MLPGKGPAIASVQVLSASTFWALQQYLLQMQGIQQSLPGLGMFWHGKGFRKQLHQPWAVYKVGTRLI